jgi:hypothetical protein
MIKGNIVNIVQHSHLYNSFLLIIVANSISPVSSVSLKCDGCSFLLL